ncbi:hypothetical protein P7D22_23265, partial [Lichenihabitans sp. Uapishka_5]|uniref:hypothetical protein n=1 Tax=Lichenihabitans sp. Uapishka_5 TaxID=3037302 RepID=UPI0029E8077E
SSPNPQAPKLSTESGQSQVFFQASDIAGYPATNLIDAGVHWTLVYEWVFYLTLPLLAFAWAKLRFEGWALFVLSVATLVLARLFPLTPPLQSSFAVPFALGGLVSEIGRVPAIRRHAAGWKGTLICASVITHPLARVGFR